MACRTDFADPRNPISWPDFPWGVAKMTFETTYTGWINNSDLNWDFSFITLDRRIGDHIGWMDANGASPRQRCSTADTLRKLPTYRLTIHFNIQARMTAT